MSELQKYDNQAVLFLDVLGFRDFISQDRGKELLEILKFAQSLTIQQNRPEALHLSAFSDSIVVSAPCRTGHDILEMIFYASFLSNAFLASGVLTRGAITIGGMYHAEGVAFGPAFVEAYDLEQNVAVYPRIVLSMEAHSAALKTLRRQKDSSARRKILRQDFDGVIHVNCLGPEAIPDMNFLDESETKKGFVSVTETRFKKMLAMSVARALKNKPQNNIRASAKYDWLERYYYDETRDKRFLSYYLKRC